MRPVIDKIYFLNKDILENLKIIKATNPGVTRNNNKIGNNIIMLTPTSIFYILHLFIRNIETYRPGSFYQLRFGVAGAAPQLPIGFRSIQ